LYNAYSVLGSRGATTTLIDLNNSEWTWCVKSCPWEKLHL